MRRSLAFVGALAALVVVTACGKAKSKDNAGSDKSGGDKAASDKADDPGSAAEAPQTKLHVKHGGAEVQMTSAVAMRDTAETIHVWIANHEISCNEILQSMRAGVPKDDVAVSIAASKRIAPDGKQSWALSYFSMEHSPEMKEMGAVQVAGDETAKVGSTVEITFDYGDAKGTVVAKGCGDRPIEKDHPAIAKAKHASTATMTIAGKQVPIVSAWKFEKTTYLSSEPITCAYAGLPTRVTLVRDQGSGDGHWELAGDWFPHPFTTSDAKIEVKEGAKGDGPDGPTVQLDLSGKATIDGYPVEVAGSIEALACVKRT